MLSERLAAQLKSVGDYFTNSTDCLQEADSDYAPQEGMFTVAQHVASAAQVIDWFVEGAFGPSGFDTDFQGRMKKFMEIKSLDQAHRLFKASIENAVKAVSTRSDEELNRPLPEGLIMARQPRYQVVWAITDHTAHHRGALTVYARLLGRKPRMPYGEA